MVNTLLCESELHITRNMCHGDGGGGPLVVVMGSIRTHSDTGVSLEPPLVHWLVDGHDNGKGELVFFSWQNSMLTGDTLLNLLSVANG